MFKPFDIFNKLPKWNLSELEPTWDFPEGSSKISKDLFLYFIKRNVKNNKNSVYLLY